MHSIIRRGAFAGRVAAALVTAGLAGPARAETSHAIATDDELRIHGVFDSALPGTERRNSLRLILHPHFGDLHQHEHLRIPFGLRYGLSDRLEVTGEMEAFVSHGLKHTAFLGDAGFSAWHVGAKYQLGEIGRTGWIVAVGFDFTRPMGAPPREITDGLKHISPYVSFSRRLESAPAWRVFWSLGHDEIRATSLPLSLRRNELGADASTISGGFLRESGAMTYTFETAWSSSRLGGKFDHNVLTVRPGFVWVVPPRYTFGDGGRWVLGAGLRLSEGPDGFDVGVSTKLRVNFNLRGWWRRTMLKHP